VGQAGWDGGGGGTASAEFDFAMSVPTFEGAIETHSAIAGEAARFRELPRLSSLGTWHHALMTQARGAIGQILGGNEDSRAAAPVPI
jgi:hypothetical protein